MGGRGVGGTHILQAARRAASEPDSGCFAMRFTSGPKQPLRSAWARTEEVRLRPTAWRSWTGGASREARRFGGVSRAGPAPSSALKASNSDALPRGI